MRELPFGAQISDSLVALLKQATAKVRAEWPGALPCICLVEKHRGHPENSNPAELVNKRIDFERGFHGFTVNRLAPYAIFGRDNERLWAVCFDKRKYAKQTTFVLDGLEVHIDRDAQAELKGKTLGFINGSIVATP